MKKLLFFAFGLAALHTCLIPLHAQIAITHTREVNLPNDGMWGYARFSPDGQKLLFTTLSYDGIWELDIATERLRNITNDEGSGFGFAVSPDGQHVAYRRTHQGATWKDRSQEIVITNIQTGTSEVLVNAKSVSPPGIMEDQVLFAIGKDLHEPPQKRAGIFLQGIVDQKIVLVVNGSHRIIDPLENGRYIWPSLSPDKSLLVAYEMDRGTIVSSVDGTLRHRLGRAEGPVWTRDGAWIIFFSEENDGYRITGGDLHAMKPDGEGRTALTRTPSRIELFPSCSPVENQIVCHTIDGTLLLLDYVVTQ